MNEPSSALASSSTPSDSTASPSPTPPAAIVVEKSPSAEHPSWWDSLSSNQRNLFKALGMGLLLTLLLIAGYLIYQRTKSTPPRSTQPAATTPAVSPPIMVIPGAGTGATLPPSSPQPQLPLPTSPNTSNPLLLNSPSQDADIESILDYLRQRKVSLDRVPWSEDALRVLKDETDWRRVGVQPPRFLYPPGIQTTEGYEIYFDEGVSKWNLRAAGTSTGGAGLGLGSGLGSGFGSEFGSGSGLEGLEPRRECFQHGYREGYKQGYADARDSSRHCDSGHCGDTLFDTIWYHSSRSSHRHRDRDYYSSYYYDDL